MKNNKKYLCPSLLPSCLLATLIILFLSTCFSPLSSEIDDSEFNDGKTRIVITLPGGNSNARNLMGDPGRMAYVLTFNGPSGQQIEERFGGETAAVEVKPGLWSVDIKLHDSVSSAPVEAEGEILNFNVKAGVPNRPKIQMRFVRVSTMIRDYLQNFAVTTPASLHMDLDIDAGTNWNDILMEIDAGGVNVNLNLSACTMTGTVFTPNPLLISGKDKIATITLPDAATSIGTCGSADPIALYLAALPGGSSTLDPLNLKLQMQLTDSAWRKVLNELEKAEKFVGLDLADCTRSGAATGVGLRSDGVFYHEAAIGPGKDRIITLALPNTATSIVSNPHVIINGFIYITDVFRELRSFSGGAMLTSIGDYAFNNCNRLNMTSLPPTITSIGDSTFTACTNLALTSLPTGLASIDSNAFAFCFNLALTSLPAGLTSIGAGAFSFCTSLALTSLPVGINFIGGYVFSNCTNLTSMSVPASTPITNNLFSGCPSITFTVTGSGMLSTAEGGRALARSGELLAYPSASGNLNLGYTTIGQGAFADCTDLININLPLATSINGHAFANCTNLKSVDLPIATFIALGDFTNCTNLENVNIPSATFLGLGLFGGSLNKDLTVTLGATPPTLGSNMFDHVTAITVTVRFPISATGYGSVPSNITTQNWGNAFRGMGWNGGVYGTGDVNGNITIVYQTY